MTPATVQALFVLDRLARRLPAGSPGVRPREFGRALWPDAPGWKVHVRTGPSGVHAGRQMVTAAGGYLARLRKAGLVSVRHDFGPVRDYGWRLTREGRIQLDAAAANDAREWQAVIGAGWQLLRDHGLEPFADGAWCGPWRFVVDAVTFQAMQRQAIRQEHGGNVTLRDQLLTPQQLLGYDILPAKGRRAQLKLERRGNG